MSRRRSSGVSTGISIDAKVAELSQSGYLAPLLYTWAIPHTDDAGRITGDPLQFKLAVCPGLPATVAEITAALEQIAAVGLWTYHEDGGRPYFDIDLERWLDLTWRGR